MSLVKYVHKHGFWDDEIARHDHNSVPVIPLAYLTEIVEGLQALDRMCAAHKIQDLDAHAVIYKLIAKLEAMGEEG